MNDDNDQAGYFEDDRVRDEFPGLIARHDHLVRALQGTEDAAMRADLAHELRRVSQQIAELTGPPAGAEEPHFEADQLSGYAEPADVNLSHELPDPPVGQQRVGNGEVGSHFSAETTSFAAPGPPEEIHPAFSSHHVPEAPTEFPAPEAEIPPPATDDPFELRNEEHAEPAADAQEGYDEGRYEPAPADIHHGDSFGTDSYDPDIFTGQPVNDGQFVSEPEARYESEPIGIDKFSPDPFGDLAAADAASGDFVAQAPPTQIPANQAPHAQIPPTQGRPMATPLPGQPIARQPQGAAAPSEADGTSLVDRYRSARPSGMVVAVVGVSLALLAGLLWFGGNDRGTESAVETVDPASPTSLLPQVNSTEDANVVIDNVRAVLSGLGLSSVVVDHRDGVIHVGGPVPTQADYDAATNAATAVAGGFPIDTSALVPMGGAADQAAPPSDGAGRPAALQTELNRILAGTPLIFASGQAALTELQQRVLNNVVLALSAYPGFSVAIVGFTDELGDNTTNEDLSLARAEAVREYLVAQGLPLEAFEVLARGEDAASGSAALAGLERRVEFVVNGAAEPAADQATLKVAIVAPSASNDLAFTQSMVDAVGLLSTETPIEISVTDNTFVPEEAAAAVRTYAEQGYDLIIAHGSQFGASLIEIAPQFPETAFAWGTASDTFGLPNVYAYDAAAEQGGYLLGAIAAMMSATDVVGVVGPIEVGDAALFVNGFEAGSQAQEPGTSVLVSYTGSFSDTGLATETAQAHIGAGADVLTGSAQMVVGAVAAAEQAGALWFGTQSNQASLAPSSVVASQVYHWEVALRPIIEDIRAGQLAGNTYTADLANGGLVIEYNAGVPMAPEIRQRADQIFAEIINGSIVPPGT